jgi:hypothetical protein
MSYSQQIGETVDAIIEDDNIRLQKIVDANHDRKEPYFVVIYVKPEKTKYNGKHALVKCFKSYNSRPASQVGMIIGEVDNKKGEIKWEVNMPQRPFDFDRLQIYGVRPSGEVVTETTTIANAYITQ